MELVLPDNVKVGMPGDNLLIKMRFDVKTYAKEGQRFAIRESGKTIAHGVITKILKDNAVPFMVGRKKKNKPVKK